MARTWGLEHSYGWSFSGIGNDALQAIMTRGMLCDAENRTIGRVNDISKDAVETRFAIEVATANAHEYEVDNHVPRWDSVLCMA